MLSVHSVVSFDFAVAQLPGWHSTIFPPYFVAGAIFSGFAMVVTLAIPARELFGLKDFITRRHLDNMAKIILVTSLMVGYAYLMEFFMAWYGGNPWEQFQFLDRVLGPMWWCGWIMLGLQRRRAAASLVQVRPPQRVDPVRRLHPDQRGHVVRAVRDHRGRAAPRFPAVELGFLLSELRRGADLDRQLRPVHDACSCCSAAGCRWWRWPR